MEEGIALYLLGGFHDVEETIKVTQTEIAPLPALRSTHGEADIRTPFSKHPWHYIIPACGSTQSIINTYQYLN